MCCEALKVGHGRMEVKLLQGQRESAHLVGQRAGTPVLTVWQLTWEEGLVCTGGG